MPKHWVATYCRTGPYRHVRALLDTDPAAWFPWGYFADHVEGSSGVPQRGDVVELWEVDDTRSPQRVEFVAFTKADYVRNFGDYLAMTLQATPQLASAVEPARVLEPLRRGQLLAPAEPSGRGVVGAELLIG
jgi:hypothetical protein